MLFNEPKLLKSILERTRHRTEIRFSALQRAEIAEIVSGIVDVVRYGERFSALQRAEIAEMDGSINSRWRPNPFQCSSTSRNC